MPRSPAPPCTGHAQPQEGEESVLPVLPARSAAQGRTARLIQNDKLMQEKSALVAASLSLTHLHGAAHACERDRARRGC